MLSYMIQRGRISLQRLLTREGFVDEVRKVLLKTLWYSRTGGSEIGLVKQWVWL